jgi:hypothetical protein
LKGRKIKEDAERKFNCTLPTPIGTPLAAPNAAALRALAALPPTAIGLAKPPDNVSTPARPSILPGSAESKANPGSTLPSSPALDRLFCNPDQVFSEDTSALDQINQLATKPINFSEPTDAEFVPKLDPAVLATLDPVSIDEIHAVAYEFHLTDLHLLEAHEKLEVMDCSHYVAKITRLSSTLQVIEPLKDNPQAKSCISDFNRHLQAFQKEGTAAVRTSVILEREYYQDQATPQLLHNFYRLCKTLVTSRSAQSQVTNLMDLARRKPSKSKVDIPEPPALIAGYALLLLLTTDSAHVLSYWAGAESPAKLMDVALRIIAATPSPCPFPSLAPELSQDLHNPGESGNTDNTATTADDDDALPQKNLFSYSQESTDLNPPDEETAPDNSSPEPSDTPEPTHYNVVLLGNRLYFPMPSAEAWDLALSVAMDLRPIANHITLERRMQLITKVTRSKCLTAMKKLAIRREVLHATTSVQKLISEKNNEANLVINVMAKWRRELFEKTKKNVHHFLNKHKGLQTASATRSIRSRQSVTDASVSSPSNIARTSAPKAAPPEQAVITIDEEEHLSQLTNTASTPRSDSRSTKRKPAALRNGQRPDKLQKNEPGGELDAQTPPSPQGLQTKTLDTQLTTSRGKQNNKKRAPAQTPTDSHLETHPPTNPQRRRQPQKRGRGGGRGRGRGRGND